MVVIATGLAAHIPVPFFRHSPRGRATWAISCRVATTGCVPLPLGRRALAEDADVRAALTVKLVVAEQASPMNALAHVIEMFRPV